MGERRTGSQENIVKAKTGKSRSRSWYIKRIVFGGVAVLALSALITVIVVYELHKNEVKFRVDCLPGEDLNYKVCMARGCEWRSNNVKGQPACFFPDGSGYKSVKEYPSENSFKADLRWTDKINFFYGKVIEEVSATVYHETENRARFQIKDPKTKRYEVPLDLRSKPSPTTTPKDYVVETTNDPQFGLIIKRNSTNTVIFDTNTPGTIFSDQFLQITIKLPSPYVFGLGEHRTVTYLHDMKWRKWNLFSRDMGPFENPEDGYNNLYGVHPFYMNVEKDGNAHGVFFLNSNAMEITLQPHPAITFRSIGGIIDLFIFLGPTPEDVVKQYLQLVGLPVMPTYWSLGFHLCRYGYKNLDDVKAVVERTTKAGIPLDVQYLDIDYMLDKRDFTYDDKEFNGLPDFVTYLNGKDIKVGVILDPAIASNSTLLGKYRPLDFGLEMNVFVKDHNGSVLEGEVWPGLTYYPDFSHENATMYWTQLCSEFRDVIHYDSMWIDMNEPSSFVEGSVKGCEENDLNYPPFAAGVLGSKNKNRLFEKTICMDAKQAAGTHYDVHSLYGHFQAKVTYSALKTIYNGTRPVIIGRSTYSGTGKYAGHWLGDNRSWWSNLRDSIPGMMRFSLFGIPYIGADICGFFDNTTEELCARWSQLGAFYPFSRNHNAEEFRDQDPAAMGDLVKNAAREALKTRYRLLPYLYTLFHYAHTVGSTVVRPLLHEFPNDRETYKISFQFLWGAALLISPAVTENSDTVECYFPAGTWYDFYTGETYTSEVGKHEYLNASWEKVNLHVREGWILPLQEPDINTVLSRKHPMQLFVAPDTNGSARGSLFWDDGETLDTDIDKHYLMLNFKLSQKNNKTKLLSITITENEYDDSSDLYFDSITLCGQETTPLKVEYKGNKVDWEHKNETRVIYLRHLKLRIMANAEILLTFN